MAAQPQSYLTPEQYLELERASEFRHDYYRGRMYLMSGGSLRHALIIGEFARLLGNELQGRNCNVVTNDLRVHVKDPNRSSGDGLYTYPDIVVMCEKPDLLDAHQDTLLNPSVLIEVLSPSTAAYDRGLKAARYRTIEGLQEYAFVWQTEPRIEVYRRQNPRQWVLTESIGLDSECEFTSIGCSVPLRDIYGKVEFEPPSADPPAA